LFSSIPFASPSFPFWHNSVMLLICKHFSRPPYWSTFIHMGIMKGSMARGGLRWPDLCTKWHQNQQVGL
jgi:hypothetical protein